MWRARRGDSAIWPDQAVAASAPGASCLGFSSPVRDNLELKCSTKLLQKNVHVLSITWCMTRYNTNVVCCSLMIPPSKGYLS